MRREDSRSNLEQAWRQFKKTNSIYFDLRQVWNHFGDLSLVHLVEPTPESCRILLDSIERLCELPSWDHLREAGETLGVMFAGGGTLRLLFAREVLGTDLPQDLEDALLENLAEKAVEPCYRAVFGMDHPEQVDGWYNDPNQEYFENIDMVRWPEIFGGCNLRTISTVGLGLGALALKDRDDRAPRWLSRAEASARKVFNFFLPDGSYFEGVSYSNTLGDLLQFCEAHRRVLGSVDWSQAMNFSGYVDFICALQLGRLSNDRPDIVNFSDAKLSVNMHGLSWIAKATGNGLAQYAAEHFCENGHFMDLVWFDAEAASAPPSRQLFNYCSDLEWVVVRSGWQANDAVLALRSGGPQNHEHADRNCLIYKVFGERLLNDPKGAAYSRDDAHWVLRLTQAHNGVLISGRGHQYHEGEEGTNASRAAARLVRVKEAGDRAWFISDATSAYQLEHRGIRRVDRTVAFAKPDLIFLLDRVHFEEEENTRRAEVELRFFPDNGDGHGEVQAGEDGNFRILRPGAVLHGKSWSRQRSFPESPSCAWEPLGPKAERLEPVASRPNFSAQPESRVSQRNFGDFPYLSIPGKEGGSQEIFTVLMAAPLLEGTAPKTPGFSIQPVEDGLRCSVEKVHCLFSIQGDEPEVIWFEE